MKRKNIWLLLLLFSPMLAANNTQTIKPLITWLAQDYENHFFSPTLEKSLKKLENSTRYYTIHEPITLQKIFAHGKKIVSIACNQKQNVLVSGSADGCIKIWDLKTTNCIETIHLSSKETITSVSISPNGEYIAYSSTKNTGGIFNKEGKKVCSLDGFVGRFMPRAFSKTAKYLLGTTNKGCACFWDTQTGLRAKTFPCHQNFVSSAEFDHTYTKFITSSHDESACIWDSKTGLLLSKLAHGHDHWLNQATVCPSGRLALTCSYDETIGIWDTITKKKIGHITPHENFWVHSVSWNNDGTMFLTIGANNEIKIWKTKSKRLLCTIKHPEAQLSNAIFAPNNKEIWYGDSNGKLNRIRITEKITTQEHLLFKAFKEADIKKLSTQSKPLFWRITGLPCSYTEKIAQKLNKRYILIPFC